MSAAERATAMALAAAADYAAERAAAAYAAERAACPLTTPLAPAAYAGEPTPIYLAVAADLGDPRHDTTGDTP